MRLIIVIATALIAILTAGRAHQPYTLQVEEKILARLPRTQSTFERHSNSDVNVDPTQKRVAYIAGNDKKEWVVVDGVKQEEFETIEPIPIDEGIKQRVFFSPSGKRLAYNGRKGAFVYLVVDGKKVAMMREPTHPHFGPDNRLAFLRRSDGSGEFKNSRYVIDGLPTIRGITEPLTDPYFSANGCHVAYFADDEKGKQILVLDGRPQRSFGGHALPVVSFSPNERLYAYFIERDDKYFLILNGQERPVPRPAMALGAFWFETDLIITNQGQFAYVSDQSDRWKSDAEDMRIVLNGISSARYDSVGYPHLDPSGGSVSYRAEIGDESFVVLRGERQPNHKRASDPIFTLDGTHSAYITTDGGFDSVIHDKDLGPPYLANCTSRIVLSPNGQRVAYYANRTLETRVLVVASTDGPPLEFESRHVIFEDKPVFSPDSRHIAATIDRWPGFGVMVDGQQSLTYTDRPPGSALVFDSSRTLSTTIIRGNDVLGLTITVPDQSQTKSQ